MTNKDCLRMEYVGLPATIRTKNKTYNSRIIDETKSTIKIIEDGKIRTLLKQNTTISTKTCTIPGNMILKRPENRIKL